MLKEIKKRLEAKQAKLVAVSKTRTPAEIMPLYEAGQRDFGENRVQEVLKKQPEMPADINWHLIGHLQTNKVKQIAAFVHLIHSVDSYKLLKEINKQGKNHDRKISCLLQFKIAEEDTKYGFDWESAKAMLEDPAFEELAHVQIAGVMGMATFTDDQAQVRAEFQQLKKQFDQLKQTFFKDQEAFKEISMGMSGDYKIAIEEGSTMVRIGSLLFGPRVY